MRPLPARQSLWVVLLLALASTTEQRPQPLPAGGASSAAAIPVGRGTSLRRALQALDQGWQSADSAISGSLGPALAPAPSLAPGEAGAQAPATQAPAALGGSKAGASGGSGSGAGIGRGARVGAALDARLLSLREPVLQQPSARACQGRAFLRYVRVRNVVQLQAAINVALPGDLIELAPGTYGALPDHRGKLVLNVVVSGKQGLPDRPIVVCGPQAALISGAENYRTKPYLLHIRDSSHVVVSGFSLAKGSKGVVVDGSSFVTLDSLRLSEVDYEGVRLRQGSSHNVVQGCTITNTGRTAPGYGEGIYVGTAATDSPEPDKCDGNQILRNRIGPGVPAEMIDIKENCGGGLIEGNTFDGSDLSGVNMADSWVDIKGYSWVVRGNVGVNAPKNGFETHDNDAASSGEYNGFANNTCYGLGQQGSPGLCVEIFCDLGSADGCSNTVACNNAAADGSGGVTNVQCVGWDPAPVAAELGAPPPEAAAESLALAG